MQVLVFDTSLDKTYITLALQDSKTETSTFVSTKIKSSKLKYHSAYLISQIKQILANNFVELKNIDAIGVNIGPGSFTGIRVCLTVAKIIAQQLNIRLVGVSSCEILSKIFLSEGKICPVLMDARREMYYCYNQEKGTKVHLFKKDELNEFFEELDKNIPIICDTNCASIIKEAGFKAINFEEESFELGEILAGITLSKLKTITKIGQCHWSAVKPLYVQTPPVLG
ncbi:MAG: tRNA (adenosine(37)-N6)-threonylcarbamoyltransferase complex dimerization subunit type 1 TsaB [Cyanobacteria bacterium SIG30]|nr:tRNA (adenosine(37)-N6)-threonylcarbamoyltransferase complex dimerization subunit type 1 TsaB [Cyanobacteria bacterium SIG30]